MMYNIKEKTQNNKKQIKKESQKGVTMVALIVTIIVLLILAGVTIAYLTGDSGVINKASDSEIQTQVAGVKERVDAYLREQESGRVANGDFSGDLSVEELKKNNIIFEITTKEGIKLGIIQDLKALGINSKFGKNGKNANDSWNGKGILELEDVFAVDMGDESIYYINNKKIWTVEGNASKEEIIDKNKDTTGDAPIVTVTPGEILDLENNNKITIKAKAQEGKMLKSTNSYEYYLSKSENSLVGGSWTKYESEKEITVEVREGNTEYYIFVRRVVDNEGVFSEKNTVLISGTKFHRYGPYVNGNEVITYKIIYNLNGGTANNPGTYARSNPTFKLNNPIKIGYTFIGWTGSNGESPQMEVAIPKGSSGGRSYTANYRANTYTVEYDGNGETGGSTEKSIHTYDTGKTLTENGYVKLGYTFKGWSTSSNGEVVYTNKQLVNNLSAEDNSQVKLYAIWNDETKPKIEVTPENSQVERNKKVIINAKDEGSGLSEENRYEYQITTSNSIAPTTWETYTNGGEITIGTNLTGTYYLWIKEVKDKSGNVSNQGGTKVGNCHVYGTYIFDNEVPKVTFTPNGNNTYGKSQLAKVDVEDNGTSGLNTSTLKYQWTQSTILPAENTFTTSFSNNTSIIKEDGTGNNWYLWILAKDNLGNTNITKSEAFYLDNTNPTNTAPTGVVTSNTIAVTLKQTDKDSGINNETKQYAIKKTEDTLWGSFVTDNNQTHMFTGLTKDTSYDIKTKVTDNAGNTIEAAVTTIKTDKLDMPVISGTPTTYTNEDVTITISYPDLSYVMKQYSYDGTNWTNATVNPTKLTVAENKTVYARIIDSTNQVSGTATLVVTNIDKVAPKIDSLISSNTNWTNESLTITGKAKEVAKTDTNGSSGINAYQFSTNGSITKTSEGWNTIPVTQEQISQDYTVTTNGTYYFYVKDVAENVSKQSIVVSNIEKEGPTIEVNPTTSVVSKGTNVTITVEDKESGLLADNKYEYQLGTSNTANPTGTWTAYTSGTQNTIGEDLTGTYYLWIREIKDNSGNISTGGTKVGTYHVYGTYVFDNNAPTVTFTPNGNNTYGKTQSTKVDVGDSGAGVNTSTLKYQWTQSTVAPTEASFTTAFTNNTNISKNDGTGNNWYLWILAKDNLANTIIKSSGVFYLDNTNPTNTLPTGVATSNTVTATFKQNDVNSGINVVTKAYAIKKTADSTWGAFVTDSALVHTFTNLIKNTSYDIKTKVTDNAGNELESAVTTINTEELSQPVVTGTPTAITNGDVTITINYPDLSYASKQYSYDGLNWTDTINNPETLTVSENKTIYARIIDSTNQVSAVATKTITNIDKTPPTIELAEESNIKADFSDWVLHDGAYVNNEGKLVLPNINSSAVSPYLLASEKTWQYLADIYVVNSAPGYTPNGGSHMLQLYYNKNYENITASNGYSVNGYAREVPLNTWVTRGMRAGLLADLSKDYGFGKDVEFVRIVLNPSETESVPPITYDNTRFTNYGGNSNLSKKIVLNIVDGETSITQRKYLKGDKTVEDFETSGTTVTDNFEVTENGIYTIYSKDTAGNKTIKKVNVTGIDKEKPKAFTPSIEKISDTIKITANTTDNDGGLGIGGYQFSKDNGQTWTEPQVSGEYTFTGLENNVSYNINVKALDKVGNYITSNTIEVDRTAPTKPTYEAYYSDGSGAYNGEWTTKEVQTKITTTEIGSGIDRIEYSPDKLYWVKFTFPVSGGITNVGNTYSGVEPWGLVNRDGTYYFRAIDKAGNVSELSEPYTIRYDLIAPTAPTISTDTNYVKSGLVLQYDGRNNTGSGHSTNTTTWKDLSGNNKDGNITGGTWEDNGIVLDGVDDGISLGNNLSQLLKQDNTLEVKVKFDELETRDIIIGNFASANTVNYEKSGSASAIHINYPVESRYIGGLYNIDTEYTISYVWNKAAGKLEQYINGIKVGEVISSEITNYNYDWIAAWIGRDYRTGDGTPLKGKIYGFRAYTKMLSETEILTNYRGDLANSEKYTGQDTQITISGGNTTSGISKYQYSLDNGSTWANYNASSKLVINKEGTTKVTARGVSNSGLNGETASLNVSIDKTKPTITTTQESNINADFSKWELSGGAYVDGNGKLVLPSGNASAISPLMPVDEKAWIMDVDVYTTSASTNYAPNGGAYMGQSYYDSSFNSIVAPSNGYAGNGWAEPVPLNTTTHKTINALSGYGYGTGVKYVRILASISTDYSVGPVTYSNFKFTTYGDTNKSKTIKVAASDNLSGISELKWLAGTKTESDFVSSGNNFTNSFEVTENGTYTIFAKDYAGNTSVKIETIEGIDREVPVINFAEAGTMLFTDPTFESGINSMIVYNNLENGTVTNTRIPMETPVGSYAMEIKNVGSASPGVGGYFQPVNSRPNTVFIHKIIAKIPVGYTIQREANVCGNGAEHTWLTDQKGTGDWKEYVYVTKCGATGEFYTLGHVRLEGPVGSASKPMTWYVAYSTIFDTTISGNSSYASIGATDNLSGISAYGINQSSTVPPTYTPYKATTKFGTTITNPITENGTYYLWVKDKVGNEAKKAINVSYIDKQAPTWTSVEVKNVSTTGYDVYVYGVTDNGSGVKEVRFPTWTEYNGQDDLPGGWATNPATLGTNLGNGTWYYRVKRSDHKGELGGYVTHVYTYDNLGNNISTGTSANVPGVIYFNANGGSVGTSSLTINYNTPYRALPIPTRAGYTFLGWYTAPSGGTQVTNTTNITTVTDHTLYAVWKSEWSEEYTANTLYTDKDGKTAMIPKGFKVSIKPDMNVITRRISSTCTRW